MSKQNKTNAMRILDSKKIDYSLHTYDKSVGTDGKDVAKAVGLNPDSVCKTLVTVGKSGEHYVFIVPVTRELDLKKAAKAVGEKSIAMIKQKELLPLTGYIHGGCSPIGMKKFFKTTLDESVLVFDKIAVSAGEIGKQVELPISGLKLAIDIQITDISA